MASPLSEKSYNSVSSTRDSSDEDIVPSPTPSPQRNEGKENKPPRIGRTISVEGNIGCGKTTFLNNFKKYKNVEFLPEPVAVWKNCNGYNALDLLYTDAQRWCGVFEGLVTMSMLEHHNRPMKAGTTKMMERSIYSVKNVFMEQMKQSGTMKGFDYAVLDHCHKYIEEHDNVGLDLIVYLRADPEVCVNRMKKRNRSEEAGVPLEYIRSLHQLHDDWLLHGKMGKVPAPVLIVDANKDITSLQLEIERLTHDILHGFGTE